jgi:hypothetical protein
MSTRKTWVIKENSSASSFLRCKTSSFFIKKMGMVDIMSTNDNLHTHLWRSSIIIHFRHTANLLLVLWLCILNALVHSGTYRGTASFRPSSFNIWYYSKCVGFLLLMLVCYWLLNIPAWSWYWVFFFLI